MLKPENFTAQLKCEYFAKQLRLWLYCFSVVSFILNLDSNLVPLKINLDS